MTAIRIRLGSTISRHIPLFSVLLLLTAPLSSQGAESPALERMNFGYSAAGTVATAPLWVTQDSGVFKKHGFDVKPIYMAGGLAPVAIMAGEVQFAIMSAGVMIPPVLKGADLVMIVGLSNYINQSLVVAPEITDAKQLKGKRIAIQRLGDLTHIAGREAVKHLGLAESDVQYQQIGGVPTRFAAMQTTRQLIASRRPMVLNLLKGFVEGVYFYKHEREASIRIIERYIPGAAKDELSEAIDHYQRDLEDRPYPRPEGIKTALDLYAQQNPAAKGVDAERFMDQSLMRELERGGFFGTLASGGK